MLEKGFKKYNFPTTFEAKKVLQRKRRLGLSLFVSILAVSVQLKMQAV
jgi:hypothetical protein